MRKCAFIILVSVLVALTANATTARTSHERTLSVSEPDALDLYIERLRFAESSGRDDVQIIDANGKWSRGCLQFQDATFARFATKYRVQGDILDCTTQRALARQILLHERNGWRNWYTSVSRIGLPPIHVPVPST